MSPAAEKPLKICIRGLPADTDHRKLQKDLRDRGFDPIFIRHVTARDKGPGIFCIQLQTTPKIETVFDIKKLLNVSVRVEAWRGRQGPPQCQRCQGFRHSAAECLQEYRCVHCARPHPSKNCNRPYDIPTCANCSGPHAANDFSCPAMRREEIAKAGKVLRTSGYTLATPNPVAETNARSSLMAVANASWLSSERKRRRRKNQAKDTRASASPEPGQSQLEKPEAQELADPVIKKPENTPEQTQKPVSPIIDKPQPISLIVQEAIAKSINSKESQPVIKKVQQLNGTIVNKKSHITDKDAQKVVDPTIKEKCQSKPQQTQQAVPKPIDMEQAKPEQTKTEQTNPDPARTKAVYECVQVLQSVLSAIQDGHNPVPIILEGVADLCRGV